MDTQEARKLLGVAEEEHIGEAVMDERIVEVEWVDTLTKHGWLAPGDVPTKAWLIRSVGYVFQDDAEGIVLLEARGESENSGERMKDCGCASMIPRSAIRKVTELSRER